MGIIRESFIIFADWDRAIRKAPDNIQLELYHALMDFAQTGNKPTDMSWEADLFFTAIETKMQTTISRYNASVENGKLGGRPSRSIVQKTEITQQNLDKPNETQQNLEEPTPNLNVYVNDNVYDNVNKKEINKEKRNTVLSDSELNSLIENEFADEEVSNKFKEYSEMRKAMGKNKAIRTHATFNACIEKLRKFANTPEEALEILNNSISNCYQGLFPLERQRKSSQKEAIPYAN